MADCKPERVRGDLRLMSRVLRERWPVTQESMERVYARVEDVALNFPDAAISIQAAKLIATMHGQNQKDEPNVQQIEHHHTHEIGPVTESNFADAKRQLVARIGRAG